MANSKAWKQLAEIPRAAALEPVIRELASRVAAAEPDAEGLIGAGGAALLCPLQPLLSGGPGAGTPHVEGVLADHAGPQDRVLVVSAAARGDDLEELLRELAAGGTAGDWPGWAAVAAAAGGEAPLQQALAALGLELPPAAGTLRWGGEHPLTIRLYPLPAPGDAPRRLVPHGAKIGEGPGNLKQRAAWFNRRTGGPR